MVRNKKLVLLVSLLVISGLLLTACGGGSQPAGQEQGEEEAVITYNAGTEPETLDVAKSTGKPEATIQMALFEGLTRLDENTQPVPGMAERWEISPDGLKYTFYLRDAKWSNGDPVTAHDFEYAWKRLLDPNTAAEYSYQLYYVKNGEAFNAGEVSADEVGIRALDDKTLEVELESPTPYFLSLTAFPNLYPVHVPTVEANPDTWAGKVETLIGNGPFMAVNWEHQSKFEMVKNPNYWAADDVKIDRLIFTMVESETTELAMFDANQIDIAENPPIEELSRLLADGTAELFPDLSVYYYMFNVEKAPFDNPLVRKAFAMAVDRQALIDNVTQANQTPAFAMVPYGLPDADPTKDFREVGGDYFKEDVEEARRLLAEAGYPDGKGLPEIKILYNTNEAHQKIAEALMEMWKQNLGVENISLTNQEWGVYLNSRKAGDYQVARAGWAADYTDAMTFLDMWTTGNGNNQTNWGNLEYDALIKKAKTIADPEERMQAMHDAEAILMEDMPVLPLYFYTNVNMYKPWVKGVIVPMVGGYQEFRWAYVEK